MKRILILGAGTAGTMMANKLVRALGPAGWTVTVVDRDDTHLYQPGLLLLPFGTYNAKQLQRPRHRLLDSDVELRLGEIDRIEPDTRRVFLSDDAQPLAYELLIVATGTRIDPTATEGLTGPGWRKSIFDFYTLDGAVALGRALERFEGGRVVINVVEMPIKCPVAPLEFLFLAEAYFARLGMREKVEIVYATPLDGAFTKPRASAMLGGLLETRRIGTQTDFATSSVDGEKGVLHAYDGREEPFDLLVTIPTHFGSEAVQRSGIGDDMGFLPTDRHTLQSKVSPEIFALGDATDLPSSKAGSVAHFQAEVLVENVLRWADDRELVPDFDGHANCFVETGYQKAILIDFNYDTEPLPGRFPLPGIGPFTLLEESAANHWGKLGFEWVYWNVLVKGRELPIDHRMRMAGKWR